MLFSNTCGRVWTFITLFLKQLILRKPMNVLEPEIQGKNRLKRTLTLIQTIGIGIGGIIGTGIFVLSGHAAANYAGPSIIIAFVLAGIVALLSALSMAEMSVMMPSSGSAYTYTYVALGEYAGFMIGWLSILYYVFGSLTATVRWSQYIVHFIDLISDYNVTSRIVKAPVTWSEESLSFSTTGGVINLPAVVITITITIILIIGIRHTANVNLVFVVIKIIILLLFIFSCCGFVNRKNYEPFIPPNEGSFKNYGFSGMLYATTTVFFAYTGFETVTIVAQEIKEPERTLPIALILPLSICLLIYVGVSTVVVGLVPYRLLQITYPLVQAIDATPFGLWLRLLLIVGAIASLTTVAITILLAQSRTLYAMSFDGLLPPIFSHVSTSTKNPWVSTAVSGGLCAILAGFFPADIFGGTTSLAALITYIFVHVCVIVMRSTHTTVLSAFQVPVSRWLVPGVGILLCILLLISTTRATGIRFGVWMAIGHIVYFGYGYRNSKTRKLARQQAFSSTTELDSTSEIGTDIPNRNSEAVEPETPI